MSASEDSGYYISEAIHTKLVSVKKYILWCVKYNYITSGMEAIYPVIMHIALSFTFL